MHKIILSLLLTTLLFVFTGCTKGEPSNTKTPNNTEGKSTPQATNEPEVTPTPTKTKTRTELWLEKIKDVDKVIYTYDQIKQYNNQLIAKSNALVDILKAPVTFDKKTVTEYINKGFVPALPKYNSGKEISASDLDKIKENRNIEAIPNEVNVKLGVAVYRANLRSLPTSIGFYDSATETYYDRIQETEIYVGMPVLVLHTSKDNEFVYIQTYFYRGWVKADSIAVCDTKEQWLSYANPASFVTITSPLLVVGDVKADMGCIFPLLSETENDYIANMPTRDNNGKLTNKEVTIQKKDANKGYLSFTKGNLISQAFKYEGTNYGWGGLNDGVDCSGFVVNLFRSFGFMLPRNTSQQSGVIGDQVIKLEGLNIDKIDLPTCLYKKGHVLVYLGKLDDVHYVIHAPQGGEQVIVQPLSSVFSNLLNATIITLS